jgi:hypothetical protein
MWDDAVNRNPNAMVSKREWLGECHTWIEMKQVQDETD